ncbi:RNA polymerase sigma factor [Plantactinospora sp. WMMC1484]|uniref:RNA polymerase sigma factor n=1 Tax=Plantactinospora sp. WMMC1484 TaxID=3404122 RepID=UPI003BF4F253
MQLTDAGLVRAAQAGEVSALGLLLTRHRPALLAVAYGVLGYGADAEDAVQETAVIALRRIGDLRDPEAVGPWLRMVVRNACRMRLRAAGPVPLDGLASLPSAEPDPADLLDRHAVRDWVWHALADLSPPLRLVLMLRYFTGVTAYQDIADACGVPVGTVRSRLADARGKLARALLATADAAHDDVRSLARSRRQEAEETLDAARRGDFAVALAAYWSPTVESSWPRGHRTTGYDYLVRVMENDLADRVQQRLTNVVAARDITIWEVDLVNPPDDPFHCPPGAVWVQHLAAGRVQRFQLHHARRPTPVPALPG